MTCTTCNNDPCKCQHSRKQSTLSKLLGSLKVKPKDKSKGATQNVEAHIRSKWRTVTLSRRSDVGFGFQMRPGTKNKGAFIESIFPGGPAADAVILQEGDKIVSISETACAELDFPSISRLLDASGPTLILEVIEVSPAAAAADDSPPPSPPTLSASLSNLSALDKSSPDSLLSPPPIQTPVASAPPSIPASIAACTYVDLIAAPLNPEALKAAQEAAQQALQSHRSPAANATPQAPAPPSERDLQQEAEMRARGYVFGHELEPFSGGAAKRPPAPAMPREVSSVASPTLTSPVSPPARAFSLTAENIRATGSALAQVVAVDDEQRRLGTSQTAATMQRSASGYDSFFALQNAAANANSQPAYGPPNYFIGMASSEATDKLLEGKANGTFVVRESQRAPGSYVLCVMFEGTTSHIPISRDVEGFRVSRSIAFPSIPELVKYYAANTLHRHFSAIGTPLITPFGNLACPV
eukprot:m.21220 g.21220  ORF g.21220 m.21220 type:complete len:469 (-) comp3605_c0_seq2:159-1565(-)